MTARHKYTEQKTPKTDEYLRELIDLGSDIGKSIPNYWLLQKK